MLLFQVFKSFKLKVNSLQTGWLRPPHTHTQATATWLAFLETERGGYPFSDSVSFSLPLSPTRMHGHARRRRQTHTHTHTETDIQIHTSAMRQGGSDRINTFGPTLNWTLLNIQKLLSKVLQCTLYKYSPRERTHGLTHTHAHTLTS